MKNPVMVKEYPDAKQRYAICRSQCKKDFPGGYYKEKQKNLGKEFGKALLIGREEVILLGIIMTH